MRRCERLESGVRWESLTLSSAWLLISEWFIPEFPRLQELDPVEILNATVLVKTGMNNNYSKSHEV